MHNHSKTRIFFRILFWLVDVCAIVFIAIIGKNCIESKQFFIGIAEIWGISIFDILFSRIFNFLHHFDDKRLWKFGKESESLVGTILKILITAPLLLVVYTVIHLLKIFFKNNK